jgi:hypothetical protein
MQIVRLLREGAAVSLMAIGREIANEEILLLLHM